MDLHVTLCGRMCTVTIEANETLGGLKALIENELGCLVCSQILKVDGVTLQDDNGVKLSELGLYSGETIEVVASTETVARDYIRRHGMHSDYNALSRAVKTGNVEAVMHLTNLVPAEERPESCDLLQHAIQAKCLPIMEYLTNAKPPTAEDMIAAVRNKQKDIVELLLTKGGMLDSERNDFLPLRVAMQSPCDPEFLEFLYKRGAKLLREFSDCALHKPNMEFLVGRGVPMTGHTMVNVCKNMKTLDGDSPLCFVPSFEYLVSQGIDVNFTNEEGENGLHKALTNGVTDVVQYLLDHGAVPSNYEDNAGWGALHTAVQAGLKASVIQQLITFPNINIDMTDNLSRTALNLACSCGKVSLAMALLDAGADPCIKDNHFGWNAYHTALWSELPTVADTIRASHPHLATATDKYGKLAAAYTTPARER
eukprot:TRINITY_DN1830_c0_g3_i1.p1 TRINITY_DN1830_c0_g3~~TRINITY_DN1830_c0_g3_i1.p1  ORF type:complete len:425 (+),score=89.81 TRINITY_DN1830_c0_g3_i1:66-1340(+)